MALSFIGKPISLISHSDVRYRGILAGIDPAASTIQLSNVFSMGTETRRPPSEFIPPVQEPYQYIIFRASEVKDLAVDDPTPRRSVHDDPAVLGASAPVTAAYPPFVPPPQVVGPPPPVPQPLQGPPQYNRTPQQQPPPPPAQQTQQAPSSHPQATAPPGPTQQNHNRQQQAPNSRRNNSIHSAAVSLETVERAIGDLRVSNATSATAVVNGGRGGRRGGRGQHRGGDAPVEFKVPTTDFDFMSSNAKFDKAALAAASSKANSTANGDEGANGSDDDKVAGEASKEDEKPVAYNPSKSFFDSLSSSTHPSIAAGGENGRGGRGRRGGAAGQSRRDEERERNVATFGEPGGSYSGWGGYGRRGGRPRRGAPRGGPPQNGTSHVVHARG